MGLTPDNPNCRYSETIEAGTIQIVLNVPIATWPAAEPLVAQLKELEAGTEGSVTRLSNRLKVRALIRRCELAGHEIRVKDVIAAANVDESLFFKWQRGELVSQNTRKQCERLLSLSAVEFFHRFTLSP